MIELKAHTSIAWWFKPYIFMLAVFCVLTRRELDEAKLSHTINRAIRIRFTNE